MQHSLPFGLGGALSTAEEEEDLMNQLIMTVFVEQPLALPKSVK